MKIFRVLIILLSLLLNGCLVHWKYFVHDETHYDNRPVDEEMFLDAKKYIRDGVLVRPDFTTLFNSSTHLYGGHITFVSKKPIEMLVSKLEILDGAEKPLLVFLNRRFVLGSLEDDFRFFYFHFSLDDIDEALKAVLFKRFERAFEEGGFTMKIYFQVDQGELHELLFKMRVEDAKDIAWGT